MAKIKRSKVKKASRRHVKKERIKVSIPTKLSEPSANLREYSVLIHGEKKIGKTTLFAQEKNALFLEFDPPQRALRILQRHVPDWPHFMAYIDLMEQRPGNIETLIVDGADLCYQVCFDWCCKKLAIVHPHDEKDYGKSWRFIRDTFEGAMLRILSLDGIAARFICHSKWQEVENRDGKTVEKLVPFLTSQAEEVLNGRIDLWGAYMYHGNKRILVIQGDEKTGAGHRIDTQLRTPEGDAIAEIPMGTDPKEAYRNLLRAFCNKQEYTHVVTSKKKKKKVKVKFKKKKRKR